jgi:signal transduction histidine kinase
VQGQTEVKELELPYAWDKMHKGLQGAAAFELRFDVVQPNASPWGLFILRLGNAYEIWLNGVLLQRQGDLEHYNGGDYAQVPRYVTVPPGLLKASNHLSVRIRADLGRKGGLTPLVIGPQSLVQSLYQQSYLLRSTGSMAVVLYSFVVGAYALLLWITQPAVTATGALKRESLYLYAAIAELMWSFGVGYMFFEEPPLPWPWWGALPVTAASIWACTMVLFCIEVAGWAARSGMRWLRRWLFLFMGVGPVLTLTALGWGQPRVLTFSYGILGLTVFSFAVYFFWNSLSAASKAQKLIAAAILANVLVGFRDLYVYRIDPSYISISWLRYSSLLFGLTLAFIVLSRFRLASAHARNMSTTLSEKVAQKELELSNAWRHTERRAREQERRDERSRILRDMHDGVGAHISTAMRQLRSGKASNQEVLHTLGESLDHLKLSIDALNLPSGDITALLANLRYRLEPRLKASDIDLSWEVDKIAPLSQLDDKAMRQIQFLVYEALSNVMQHSLATKVSIQAAATADGVRLRVVDNGCGFDVSQPWRKGLLSMRDRASAIGGTLMLHSVPGNTVVEILIAPS